MTKLNIKNETLIEGDHILYDNRHFKSEVIILAIDYTSILLVVPSNCQRQYSSNMALPWQDSRINRVNYWSSWTFAGKPRIKFLPDPQMIWQFNHWVTEKCYLEEYFIRKLKPEEYEIVFE